MYTVGSPGISPLSSGPDSSIVSQIGIQFNISCLFYRPEFQSCSLDVHSPIMDYRPFRPFLSTF